jgi:hypothetical protein
MPAVRRFVSYLFTFSSAVLCVATLVLLWPDSTAGRGRLLWDWARPLGYELTPEQVRARMDKFGTAISEIQWILRAQDGRFVLERYHYGDPTLRNTGMRPQPTYVLGFSTGEMFFRAPNSSEGSVPGSMHWRAVPIWPATLLTAVLPILATRSILRRRRQCFQRKHGLCLSCGYDLRASPERCPECGAIAGS